MPIRRRDLLFGAASGVAGVGLSRRLHALQPKELVFYHTHTNESLQIIYDDGTGPIGDAIDRISFLLRDFRTGDVHPIDTAVLDTLHLLYAQFDQRGRFEIISGYRSPRTNEALRRASSGVAEKSLHTSGRAIDVRLTGTPTDVLRDAAIALGRGGVGYYHESDFVHLDTGRIRYW